MGRLFKIHAIHYGSHGNLTRALCLLGKDPEDTAPVPLDYFVWVARNDERTVLIDAGASQEEAVSRDRQFDFRPCEGLVKLGIEPNEVTDLIVTHMHWDHAGTIEDYPNAQIHVQRAEMEYVTGPCMQYMFLRKPFSADQIATMVHLLHEGRVTVHDGDEEIVPGLSIHLLGGHSRGLQCVRLDTQRGAVVVASDAVHFYENLRTGYPFFINDSTEATLRGYKRIQELAETLDHVIPGHDPDVIRRYPVSAPGLEGIAARVDIDPSA